MRVKINKEFSIKRSKLSYHFNTELLFHRIYENAILINLLMLPVFAALNHNYHNSSFVYYAILFFWLFTLWHVYFINSLTIISGSNENLNRMMIVKIIKSRYPDLKINDSGQQVIRCTKSTGLLTWGKQLTVIFDQDRIFLNLTTFGRYQVRSLFHAYFNMIEMKKIKKEFRNMLEAN